MKPAFSLIVFTVLTGAGFGLFSLTVIQNFPANGQPLSSAERNLALMLSLVMIAGGLVSSVFHLANKRKAILAFSRVRTSWLSREGVFSLLFFVPALIYLVAPWLGSDRDSAITAVAGGLAVVLAMATVFCTGMIYASLKTIRQWHNPLVPVNYLLLSLASGAVLLSTIRAGLSGHIGDVIPVTLVLLFCALAVKLVYYYWIGKPAGPDINSALAMRPEKLRLLDVGHSHGTFLTDEFGHRVPLLRSLLLRSWVVLGAYLAPIALLFAVMTQDSGLYALLAVIIMFTGLLTERWLFLIEGQHVVNLYHGRART